MIDTIRRGLAHPTVGRLILAYYWVQRAALFVVVVWRGALMPDGYSVYNVAVGLGLLWWIDRMYQSSRAELDRRQAAR